MMFPFEKEAIFVGIQEGIHRIPDQMVWTDMLTESQPESP